MKKPEIRSFDDVPEVPAAGGAEAEAVVGGGARTGLKKFGSARWVGQ